MVARKRVATRSENSHEEVGKSFTFLSRSGVYASISLGLLSIVVCVFSSYLPFRKTSSFIEKPHCNYDGKQWKQFQQTVSIAVATAQSQKLENVVSSACKNCDEDCTKKLLSFKTDRTLLQTVISKQFVILSKGSFNAAQKETEIIEENDKIFDILLVP